MADEWLLELGVGDNQRRLLELGVKPLTARVNPLRPTKPQAAAAAVAAATAQATAAASMPPPPPPPPPSVECPACGLHGRCPLFVAPTKATVDVTRRSHIMHSMPPGVCACVDGWRGAKCDVPVCEQVTQ